MNRYQEDLSRIRKILQDNPRGMTIRDISQELCINRNSIAKYTDVLLALGHVDLKRVGPAKLYFLSQRVPISSILNFSSDFIAVLNKKYEIIQINQAFLDFLGIKRDKIIGYSIKSAPSYISNHTELMKYLEAGLNGTDSTQTLLVQVGNKDYYLRIKFIPTTFDDGEPGITLIMEDVTEKRKAREKLKDNEAKLNTLFNEHPDSVIFIDTNNRITQANPAAIRVMKLDPSTSETSTYYDPKWNAVRQDGTKIPLEEMTVTIALREKRSIYNVVRGIKQPNGEITWYNVSTIPVLDENINSKGVYLISKEIKEKMNHSSN